MADILQPAPDPAGLSAQATAQEEGQAADGIVWEDQPDKRSQPRKWGCLLSPLMAQVGRWAKVASWERTNTASQYASHFRRAREIYAIPPGRWEFRSASFDGGSALYARYLGPDNGETK